MRLNHISILKRNIELMNQKRPIAVDLFAGAGGMTLGFEQAGFDVLAAVEIDPIHCATHEYNFPFWSVLCRSVTEIKGEEIRSLSSLGDREIDVVFGGPPCQGFSLIGKRSLDDPRNRLVFHFLRLIVELKPKFFVMENVRGMTIGKHRQFLQEILSEFRENGYEVAENYQVLNSAYYGVPQNRERLFLLGCRQDLPLPQYPQAITEPKFKKANKNNTFKLPNTPSVWEAIQDLPEADDYPELKQRDLVVAEYGKPSDYAKSLRGFSFLKDDYSYPRKFDSRILTSSLRTEHTLESIKRFAQTPQGKTEPISRFYKLSPDGLCNTLRAGTASNRGAFTSPRPIHPFTPRCITVREAARLHSYPDWFRFHVTKWHGFRQIGNSVPPLLAKAVASEIMELLNISPSKPGIIQALGDENLLAFDMSQAAEYYGVHSHIIEPRTRNSGRKKAKIKNE
jgi:DNA (cytosine-5)-methyltransferase 1